MFLSLWLMVLVVGTLKKYINTEACILFVSIIHEKNIICDTILQFWGRK